MKAETDVKQPPSNSAVTISHNGRVKRSKPSLVSVREQIAADGFDLTLTDETIENIRNAGFRGFNLPLALVATDILIDEQPITLRGLMYRVVSAGWLPSTDRTHYAGLSRIMVKLREVGIVPFEWIVDGIRSTIKPSSWSGLADYVKTVRDHYRMSFWPRLHQYVHIIVEKDAIAGVLSPLSDEYDVRLSPLRGYSSLSFAHEIASIWNRIEKPIFAYYLGDFDPSGFDLERDIKAKLMHYTDDTRPQWFEVSPHSDIEWYISGARSIGKAAVFWNRLAVNEDDFDEFNLLPLAVKTRDTRSQKFIDEYGEACAELDALPSSELRRRVKQAIESHIPQGEWEQLQNIEQRERELWQKTLAQFKQ